MITYGNGEVLFDGLSKGIEIKYRGEISIISSPDSLFLSANKNTIIGVMLNGEDMPQELFKYRGEFEILTCKSVQDNIMKREPITLQGVDYWELDGEKWEDDGSLWGTRNGTYLIGPRQRYNNKKIVVNNNIRTQLSGQYEYKDGSPVKANEFIHIYNDGTIMTEAKYSKDSVEIYPPKGRRVATRRQISQIRRATTTGGGGGY